MVGLRSRVPHLGYHFKRAAVHPASCKDIVYRDVRLVTVIAVGAGQGICRTSRRKARVTQKALSNRDRRLAARRIEISGKNERKLGIKVLLRKSADKPYTPRAERLSQSRCVLTTASSRPVSLMRKCPYVAILRHPAPHPYDSTSGVSDSQKCPESRSSAKSRLQYIGTASRLSAPRYMNTESYPARSSSKYPRHVGVTSCRHRKCAPCPVKTRRISGRRASLSPQHMTFWLMILTVPAPCDETLFPIKIYSSAHGPPCIRR